MSLAERIIAARMRRGESLQDVADAVGVSKTHIWELEKGRASNPSVDLIVKLANHFNVTVSNLVGEDIGATDADQQLMRMFRQVGKLDPNERAILDDMIRGMTRRKRDQGDSN